LHYLGGVFLLWWSRCAVLPELIFIRQSVVNVMNKKAALIIQRRFFGWF